MELEYRNYTWFDNPKQVRFTDKIDENAIACSGIVFHDYIICACCGGIIELEEAEIIEVYDDWVDFSEYIR